MFYFKIILKTIYAILKLIEPGKSEWPRFDPELKWRSLNTDSTDLKG